MYARLDTTAIAKFIVPKRLVTRIVNSKHSLTFAIKSVRLNLEEQGKSEQGIGGRSASYMPE